MWITLTEQHVESSLNQIELEIYNKYGTSIALTERLPEIIKQTVAKVRMAIASCERNKMSVSADTIPEGFVYEAVAMARYRLLTALPHCKVSKDRKDQADDATEYFTNVACCKIRPEAPQDPRENEAPTLEAKKDIEVVRSRRQVAGRENLKGL